MLGITIGIGIGWAECAEWAASRMQEYTGIECIAVTHHPSSLSHPAWLKLWLPEMYPDDDLMIFDADMICMKVWHPDKMLEDHDAAWVLDTSGQIQAECLRLELDQFSYANTGLILLRKGCKLLEDSQRFYPKYGTWMEQSGVNAAAIDGDYDIRALPSHYNKLVRKYQHGKPIDRDAVNLHFVGLRGDSSALRKVQVSYAN